MLGLFCSGAVVAVAGPAAAGPVEAGFDYRCALPNGHSLPVRAQVKGGLPDDTWKPNSTAYGDYTYIDVDVSLGGDPAVLGNGLSGGPGNGLGGGLRIDGDSTATLGATFDGPSGTHTAEAGLTFAPTRVGGSGFSLRAAGGFPALMFFRRAGDHVIRLGDLELSLRPELADGRPLGTITTTCTLAPGQGDVLGTLWVEGIIIERPVRPTGLHVTASTPTTVTLAWQSVPWWFETRGHDVYLDGVKVAFVPEKQTTLTGLAPDSQHRVKIVTRDDRGFASSPGQGLVFATPPR